MLSSPRDRRGLLYERCLRCLAIVKEGKEMTSPSPRGFNSGGRKVGLRAAMPVDGQPCEGLESIPSET